MIKLTCPNCSAPVEAPDDSVGQPLTCPNCKHPFDVPDLKDAPEAKPPEAKEGTTAGATTPTSGQTTIPHIDPALIARQQAALAKLGANWGAQGGTTGVGGQPTVAGQPPPPIPTPTPPVQPATGGWQPGQPFATATPPAAPPASAAPPPGAVPAFATGPVPQPAQPQSPTVPPPAPLPPFKPTAPVTPPTPTLPPPTNASERYLERGGRAAADKDVKEGVAASSGKIGEGTSAGGAESPSMAGAAMGVVGGGVGAMTQVIAGITSGLGKLMEGFTQVTNAITPFVGAFSPATVLVFQMAVDQVTATIGRALAPVLEAATVVVREFAEKLAPIVAFVQPIFASIANTIGGVLSAVIDGVAATIQGLMPLMALVADIFRAIAAPVQAVIVVISALVSSFASWLGGGAEGMKSWTEKLVDLMQQLAAGIVLAVGAILRWFGLTTALGNLIKGLTPGEGMAKKGMADFKAPTGTTIGDISAYGKSVSTGAFGAVGGPPKAPDATLSDYMAEAVEKLKDLQSGTLTVEKAIRDLETAVIAKMKEYYDALKGKVYEAGSAAAGGAGSAIARGLGGNATTQGAADVGGRVGVSIAAEALRQLTGG